MTPDELGQFLVRATAIDPRVEPNDFATEMWWETIGDLRFDRARDALIQHYRDTKERVFPADIHARVRAARKARADALPSYEEIMSDVDTGHPSWERGLQHRIAAMLDDELTLEEARAKFPPPPIRALDADSTDGDLR